MQDISKLCMICLSVKDENDVCPRCKRNIAVRQDAPLLPLKSIINERYCIAKSMKRNGEGVTYAAYDLKLDKAVSVREFFPESIASRSFDELTVVPAAGSESDYSSCRASFIELWTKLMRLKGLSALVTVTDVFQANSTAYAVYEESELVNLNGYLNNTSDGFMIWEKARILFMPVLSTLGTLHTSGVLHRGINPRSFIFSKDGKLKLTDFCAAQARTLLSDIEPELFAGYTPYEQYSADGKIGPWSDIYSFCAVIYRTLIGKDPIDSKDRAVEDKLMIPAKFAEIIPSYVINALINGMQIMPEDRTQNIEQLRSNLSTVQRSFASSVLTHTTDPSKYTPAAPIGAPVADPVPTRERTDNPVTSYNSYAQRMQMQPERSAPVSAPVPPATHPEPPRQEPVSGYGQPVSGFRPVNPEPVYTQQVTTAAPPVPPQYAEPVRPAPQSRYVEPEHPAPQPQYAEPVQTVQRAPQYTEPERPSTTGERVDEYRRAVEEIRRLDEEKRERKKKGLIVVLIILILLLLGVGVFIARELLHLIGSGIFGGNEPKTTTASAVLVKVPDFKTAKIRDIMNNETYTKNFTIVQKAQSSDTVAEGTVLDQDIVANQTVPQGTTITLTVSTGPKMVKIPDVSGKTYEEAEAELKALGFKCSKSSRQNDGTHAANTVAETSPLKDSEVKEGTLVMIVLWKDVETTAPVIDIGQQAQTTVPATSYVRPTPTRPSTTAEPDTTSAANEYPPFEVTEYVDDEPEE
jgi:serine/threonine protein kinase